MSAAGGCCSNPQNGEKAPGSPLYREATPRSDSTGTGPKAPGKGGQRPQTQRHKLKRNPGLLQQALSSLSRLPACKRLAGARSPRDHEKLRVRRAPLGRGRVISWDGNPRAGLQRHRKPQLEGPFEKGLFPNFKMRTLRPRKVLPKTLKP